MLLVYAGEKVGITVVENSLPDVPALRKFSKTIKNATHLFSKATQTYLASSLVFESSQEALIRTGRSRTARIGIC